VQPPLEGWNVHRTPLTRPLGPLLLLSAVCVTAYAAAQGDAPLAAPSQAPPSGGSAPAGAPLKPEQLEALVAPVALYPDPLLAQVLMASTYPLEVVQAARWSKANPKVTGKELQDAMLKQSWDPSVKSLCSLPDTLAMMNERLEWTQALGDAFLGQQEDVMDAVQALRNKAMAAGNLKSSKELTVTTEKPPPPPADAGVVVQPAAQPQQIIVIQPANPQVIYVPQYNPVVVYGTWPYPAYPPYPVYPPGYVAATAAISFGVGMAVGAAMWGGCHWGYHGYSSVNINVNNYNRYNHTNISNTNNNWNHNTQHRQGVPYNGSGAQQKYGSGRGSSPSASTRDAYRGRTDTGGGSARPGGGATASQRPAGGANNVGQTQRPSGGGAAGGAGGPGKGQRPSASPSTRPAGGGASGGSAFQGMNSGGQARAASSRGNASMGASGRGGGGGGGGGRRR
jgi:hypothetical protein